MLYGKVIICHGSHSEVFSSSRSFNIWACERLRRNVFLSTIWVLRGGSSLSSSKGDMLFIKLVIKE